MGRKSEGRMLNGFGLTQRAWNGRDGLDLSDLVAAQRRALRWGSAPPETRPKMPNRFWDACE